MYIQSSFLHLPSSINFFPLTTISHSHHPLFPSSSSSFYRPPPPPPPTSLTQRTRNKAAALWIAHQASSESSSTTPPEQEEGPIELPPVFATDDNPSPLQVTTSVLLTGAIAVFLFRSLRRRAKRAKELRFRSTGVKKKTLQEEAMDSLKALTPVEEGSPPSPIQALLGGLSAGVIALLLYKFTLTVESGLNRQNISDDFSVRQITITVRTIINGICYLATFVFGINGIGLILYSLQLAINSFMEGGSTEKDGSGNDDGQLSSTTLSTNSSVDNENSNSNVKDQASDKAR